MSAAARTVAALALVLGPLLTTGCRGDLIATAELHGPGTADATFNAPGTALEFWADTDGKWTGPAAKHAKFPAHYEIDVLSQGAKVGHVSCDSQSSSDSVCGTRVSVNSTHSGDCELKLPCSVPPVAAGEASVHVVATTTKDVIEVRKMSINVRKK